jgi:glycosyltransferase involved in cell wall biosynthesis
MFSPWGVTRKEKLAVHFSYGRIFDEIAKHFKKCYISVPICKGDFDRDYTLNADNIEIIPQPGWRRAIEGLRHPFGILKSAKRVVDSSDVVFIRGQMPYLPLVSIYCAVKHKPVVLWVIGNPIAIIKSADRSGKIFDLFSYLYALLDGMCLKVLRYFSTFYIIANGCELYEKYKSARTKLVVSSSIKKEEFYRRKDTCQNKSVRILFVSFVRPEKGLTYLIDALGRLKTRRDFVLAIVGDNKTYPQEVKKARDKIAHLKLEDKVTWEGHASFGPQLFEQFQKSDIFVLPTLSEGTPRVLIEARAFGLPVIASNVGGIPSSITDGKDGIMVPAKSPEVLAEAIDKIIEDSEFRRNLIHNGYLRAEKHTLEKFVDSLIEVIGGALVSASNFK